MKIRFLSVILLLCLFTACNRSKQPTTAPSDAKQQEKADQDGYMLRTGGAFYTLKEDTGEAADKTVWTSALALGEKVTVLAPLRKLTFTNGKVNDFTKIKLEDGRVGFVWASQVAIEGKLAVITEEKANLYKTPKNVDVLPDQLPSKTVVAIYPDTQKDNFVALKGYNPITEKSFNNVFVKSNTYSTEEKDVQSAILLGTALSLKNDQMVQKEALLNSALTEYSESVFRDDIADILERLKPDPINTEVWRSDGYITSDNVSVRELPSAGSRLVGQLAADTTVIITEATVNTYSINNTDARWYRVRAGTIEGWVFGAFIETNY